MSSTKPFKQPDEKTMLTAMVLKQLKDVLEQQKSHIAVLQAQATNDYYWAMFDPLDEQQWLHDDYGDIREMPLFANRVSDEQQSVLEFLKDRGVVKRLKVHATNEDPENMGWKDYVVINSFEVEVNLTKFLKYFDNYMKAAQPAIDSYLNSIEQSKTHDEQHINNERASDFDATPTASTVRARVEPRSYDRANGVLLIAGQQVQIIKQPNRKGTQQESKEARLMRLLFEDVKSNFGTVAMRTVLSVRQYEFKPKHRKLVKSYVSEINKKVYRETAIKDFLLTNQLVVMINELYLK